MDLTVLKRPKVLVMPEDFTGIRYGSTEGFTTERITKHRISLFGEGLNFKPETFRLKRFVKVN